MAASSSGSNNNEVDTAMEEGHDGEGPSEAVCVADISFEEFLRQRQEDGMQGQASSVAVGNVEVDESPLKPSINRNKESLKIKLQMRRPITQLVEQGIMPSPNTPPAYACQRVKLERARMGDLLKAKIQSRPSRQELVRQHILEETDPRVAPLLAEKQRMLKRARLADSLNDHLIHRPGPLELVKKNILHAPDESIEKAIKEGIVPFKATCEGATPGPPLPTKYICQEDDSSSDVSSPSVNLDSVSAEESAETPPPASVSDAAVPEPVIEVQNKAPSSIPSSTPPQQQSVISQSFVQPPPPPPYPFAISEIQSSNGNGSQIFAVPFFGNVSQSVMTQQAPVFQSSQPGSGSSSFKSRSKKISKSKSQSKPKTIKFHEYRGPPSSQKSCASNATEQVGPKRPSESSYELLLQQQQLFLQWQLEWQHRFPKILLPAVSKMSAEEKKAFCSTLQSSTSTFPSTASHQNLDHGSLPMQIISNPANSVLILSSTESCATPLNTHQTVTYVPQQATLPQQAQTATLVITTPSIQRTSGTSTPKTENETPNKSISTKLNDWKVNELKAELKKRNLPVSGSKSQLVDRLQASYLKGEKDPVTKPGEQGKATTETKENGTTTLSTACTTTTTQPQELKFFITSNNSTLLNPEAIEFLQKSGILKANDGKDVQVMSEGIPITIQPSSRSVLQQKIQQKMQLQAKNQLMNMSKNEPEVTPDKVSEPKTWVPTSSSPSLVLVKTEDATIATEPGKVSNIKTSNSSTQLQSEDPWVLKITETTPSSASFENCLADLLSTSQPAAAGAINHGLQQTSQTQEEQDHVKSQMVDDVLEILIRNGELPASAAQDISQHQSSIPPAPPLPPTTFAVTLPTEISFRRLAQPTDYPKVERKGSLGITSLTKEAQDILKIREDLVKPLEIGQQEQKSSNQPHHSLIKKEAEEEFMELDNNVINLDPRPTRSINGDSIVIDELLTEALEFPMDLDAQYSDWLSWYAPDDPTRQETTSVDNTHNNFNHNHDKTEDSRDPLLSSTKSSNNATLDNLFPLEQGNHVMDVDTDHSSGGSELLKIRKQDVNVNHNDLWDFSF